MSPAASPYAPAPAGRPAGADGCRAPRRPAASLSPRLYARSEHQRRRADRRAALGARLLWRTTYEAGAIAATSTGSTASARPSSRPRSRRPRPRRGRARHRGEGRGRRHGGASWHPGVVGLVAARLKERYGRPAFAIALEPGGIGTGSGRSITGVDLGARCAAVADRAADQGRRPRDGGRHHHCARQARGLPRLPGGGAAARSSRRASRTALEIDGALSAARRDRRDAQRHRRGPGPSAQAKPSRCSRCRPIPSLMRRRSGRRMCACG